MEFSIDLINYMKSENIVLIPLKYIQVIGYSKISEDDILYYCGEYSVPIMIDFYFNNEICRGCELYFLIDNMICYNKIVGSKNYDLFNRTYVGKIDMNRFAGVMVDKKFISDKKFIELEKLYANLKIRDKLTFEENNNVL